MIFNKTGSSQEKNTAKFWRIDPLFHCYLREEEPHTTPTYQSQKTTIKRTTYKNLKCSSYILHIFWSI
jgi:hypothetical protein